MKSTTAPAAVNLSTAAECKRLLWEMLQLEPAEGTRAALSDAREEGGRLDVAEMLRASSLSDTVAIENALDALSLKVGRKTLASWLRAEIKAAAADLYAARHERRENPDGEFDKQGRWYPTDEEDCGDIAGNVRGPSRAWPYSYMLRARTRQHCQHLIRHAVLGFKVPKAAAGRAAAARQQLLSALAS